MAFDINKKIIPIGISDYKEMLDYNYYYVDKTSMLKDIIDFRCKVSLFTRPRRFGKTLNLSMIKYFFEKTDEDNSYLFKDKKIWQFGERYQQHQGKYPVINLDFKSIEGLNWESAYEKIKLMIANEYIKHDYLLNSEVLSDDEKSLYTRLKSLKLEATETECIYSIKNLCVYLEKYHNQKPIILIDEYDVPLQRAYLNGYYKQAITFFRGILQEALKTNNSLEFAVMTGCLRISKESIFTGLNNLNINSILDVKYSEHFGFMQDEVDEMLKYYGLEEQREKIKEWYDGYRFGVQDIYNSWSILKYIDDVNNNNKKQPEAYWVNTSGNDIVKKLIKNADNITKNEIETLINEGTIEKTLNANITYNELDENTENIWSMLFFTGYLTYTKERREGERTNYYELKIPNEELLYIYENIIRHWFEEKVKEKDFSNLYKSLINGDEEGLRREINKFLIENISFYDAGENFYHGILLGIFGRIKDYVIYSNMESGLGRSDIILQPIDDRDVAIIIEIKVTKDIEEIENKCEEALEQIENKKYETLLKKQGFRNIMKYGIAFFKKICFVKKG